MLDAQPIDEIVAVPTTVVPIDDLPINRAVKLIKIDVEGMEPDVLLGARAVIARDRPLLFFEVLNIDVLHACRHILSDFDYELMWLETPAFNPDNFLKDPDNIWSWGEVGVLAMPTGGDPRVAHLPRVTGLEEKPPQLAFVP